MWEPPGCCLAFALQDLSLGRLDCTPDPIYSQHIYTLKAVVEQLPPPLLDLVMAAAGQLPAGLQQWLSEFSFGMRPIEYHAMVLAVFASFVAPFGERPSAGLQCMFLASLMSGRQLSAISPWQLEHL